MLDFLQNNWEAIVASALVVISSVDKVAIVALKTVHNIMNAWEETFHPPKSGMF